MIVDFAPVWSKLERYFSFGAGSSTGPTARRIALVNVLSAFSTCSTLIFLAICVVLGPEQYFSLILALANVSALYFITPLFHRFGSIVGAIYFWATTGIADTVFVLIAGRDLAAHYFLLSGPPIAVMMLGPNRRLLAVPPVAIYIILFLTIEKFAPARTSIFLPDWFATMSLVFCVVVAAMVNFLAAVYAFQRAETAEHALELEHQRSERLLNSLVPAAIASRLKERPKEIISDDLPSVTILFADLVAFTPRAAILPASELVSLLNRVFSEFDRLTEKHGLETIKTIGDAYMVAGGVPVPQSDHATAVADMALEMLVLLRRLSDEIGQELDVRIGIDSGPIVAGVIGSRKPFYDLWGDTVNTAARMESHGIPGQIQVTSRAKDAIGPLYIFEERGLIDVKGKGKMLVHLLKGHRYIKVR
ncbi:adenylate/guanylate cyclase domain-containing protein [Mesorhizobium sp. CA15]|uniref:adenylate/guanylate cyclase domain-containing protein n=1 Tax=Mesorhizobium sp. CA15 TaxID=2876641 RepID=UPI001CD067E7|nr:adenylate/guanylate cyclase domain-containing protein [Mesorhizobium sp. CA15]MBZ9867013.1 adenylate/guanylate cyclase domain-containing protein [Mesorhizobium sp. CA15]